MLNKLKNWVWGVKNKLFNKRTAAESLGIDIAVSDVMAAAITRWANLYENNPAWKSESVRPLNLPAIVASKIAKMVTLEAEFGVSGSPRADYINQHLEPLRANLRNYTEYGCAKGGIVLKPYPCGDKIVIDAIQGDCFFPTRYDSNKQIMGALFVAQKVIGKSFYTRIERHELNGTNYTIENRAYKSDIENALGKRVPLSSVEEWAELSEQETIQNVKAPLFSYFRVPFANQIDVDSPLGVSVYSRAVDTFRQLDEQYARFIWEFEGGELAVHASGDLFQPKFNDKGDVIGLEVPKHKKRLYRLIGSDDDGKSVFETFAPAFRDASLLNGFDAMLRTLETQCGLAFGTLSNPQSVDKTATEIIHAKQESYSTVMDIQKAWETAIKQLVYAMDVWCTINRLAPAGIVGEPAFYWDDSIITDKEEKKKMFWQYVTAGKFPMWKFLTEFEGYDEAEAKALTEETEAGFTPYGL